MVHITAKFALTIAVCALGLVSASASYTKYPVPHLVCYKVPKSAAVKFIDALFTTINKCQVDAFRKLVTPGFKQFVFNGINSRSEVADLLTTICSGTTTPVWKARVLHRVDARTFAVEVKVFKGKTLLFTLNNSYTLAYYIYGRYPRRRSLKLESSINVLRPSDLAPFSI